MKRLVILVVIVAWGTFSFADFPGSPIGGGGGTGTTNASDLSSGTVAVARGGTGAGTAAAARAALGTDNAANIDGTKGGLDNTAIGSTTPAAGSFSQLTRGTVSDTEFSYLDGVTSAIQGQLDLKAPLISPSFTTPSLGAATATTLNTGQGAYELYAMDQNVRSTDNVTFNTVTVTEGIISTPSASVAGYVDLSELTGNGTDKIRIQAPDSITTAYTIKLPAAACGSGSSLVSGGDNTYSCVAQAAVNRTKTFSFAIDNVIATDNVLMWRVPVAVTLTRADCYATVDNVVGSLMECATDNVTSCTVLDAWTVTNAVDPFTDSSMTDGAVAAGAWIRWSTTSVGTASLNRLSCTIQYNE